MLLLLRRSRRRRFSINIKRKLVHVYFGSSYFWLNKTRKDLKMFSFLFLLRYIYFGVCLLFYFKSLFTFKMFCGVCCSTAGFDSYVEFFSRVSYVFSHVLICICRYMLCFALLICAFDDWCGLQNVYKCFVCFSV